MKAEAVDRVFAALAHPARRKMLDLLQQAPGMSVKALGSHFDFSRIAVLKHLTTLEAAGLVISEKEGRVRQLWLNTVPIQQIYERWTDRYSAFWAGEMTRVQRGAESRQPQRLGKKKKHA